MEALAKQVDKFADRSDGGCFGVNIDGGDTLAVGFDHHWIGGDRDHFELGERRTDSLVVFVVGNFVCNNCDVALGSFGGNLHRPLTNIDRARGRFDDHQRVLDGLFGQPREGADSCFEVGNDNCVSVRYGAEQLLSGQATSGSIRFGIVDSVYNS